VVKHIHVEYPEEDDDDDDDDHHTGFLRHFAHHDHAQKEKNKNKKVKAIFAYIDRMEDKQESEFDNEQSIQDRINLIGTYFEKVYEP
jgi:hypothetical protein